MATEEKKFYFFYFRVRFLIFFSFPNISQFFFIFFFARRILMAAAAGVEVQCRSCGLTEAEMCRVNICVSLSVKCSIKPIFIQCHQCSEAICKFCRDNFKLLKITDYLGEDDDAEEETYQKYKKLALQCRRGHFYKAKDIPLEDNNARRQGVKKSCLVLSIATWASITVLGLLLIIIIVLVFIAMIAHY